MPEEDLPLACRILCALSETAPTAAGNTVGLSLPRLGKRLGQGASVLMRELTYLGSATLAGRRGPGWVRVEHKEGRWVAHLTAEGRAVARGAG